MPVLRSRCGGEGAHSRDAVAKAWLMWAAWGTRGPRRVCSLHPWGERRLDKGPKAVLIALEGGGLGAVAEEGVVRGVGVEDSGRGLDVRTEGGEAGRSPGDRPGAFSACKLLLLLGWAGSSVGGRREVLLQSQVCWSWAGREGHSMGWMT